MCQKFKKLNIDNIEFYYGSILKLEIEDFIFDENFFSRIFDSGCEVWSKKIKLKQNVLS